jgi:hypothetical protein
VQYLGARITDGFSPEIRSWDFCGYPDPAVAFPLGVDIDGDGHSADDDCDDFNSDVYDGATEICDDLIDNDCDGDIDCEDADCSDDPSCACTDEDGDGYYVEEKCPGETDCDDTDATIHPGAYDPPDDGIDQDCDGQDSDGEPPNDLSRFNRISIEIRANILVEYSYREPESRTFTNLWDWGHEGGFSGTTYTVDDQWIGTFNTEFTMQISATLDSEAETITQISYVYEEDYEDDNDIDSKSTETLEASNIERISSSDQKLVFRVEGTDVCDRIDAYSDKTIDSWGRITEWTIEGCDADSSIEVSFYH